MLVTNEMYFTIVSYPMLFVNNLITEKAEKKNTPLLLKWGSELIV